MCRLSLLFSTIKFSANNIFLTSSVRVCLLSFSEQAQTPSAPEISVQVFLASLKPKNHEGGRMPFQRKLNYERETMCKTILHFTQIVICIRHMCLSISTEAGTFFKYNDSATSKGFQIAITPVIS
jgi:hypothetical protein